MRILPAALTVLWVTLKRIAKNWRLASALFAGLALAAGVMATIPIATSGSLQKSFLRHWLELETGRPPFTLIMAHDNERRGLAVDAAGLQSLQRYLEEAVPRAVGRQPQHQAVFGSLGGDPFLREGAGAPDLFSPVIDLAFMSNLADVAAIAQGRWYAERADGVVEVVVDEAVLDGMELVVGKRYVLWYSLAADESAARGGIESVSVTVEVVGVFQSLPGMTAREWIYPPPFFGRAFVHPSVFTSQLLGTLGFRADSLDFQWVFDYQRVRVDDLGTLIGQLRSVEVRAGRIVPRTTFWWSPLEYFRSFHATLRGILLFLLSLSVPAAGLVLFYVVLMAGLTVEHRRGELAVLQSRGGGRLQMLASFVLEWALLGGVAALVGPFIGWFIASAIGSSAGFLSFVDREALPCIVSRSSFLYAGLASLTAVAAASLAVSSTFRHSIVTLRQAQARASKRPVWHRFYLDVVLVALAYFGYRSLSWQSFAVSPGSDIEADPVLFFVPVVAILGVGLLFLRLYPLAMGGLSWLSARARGIVWQLTFRRLARSAAQAMALLLLLITTTAVGIYSAAAARTLSRNLQDGIRYEVGADLATTEQWFRPEPAGEGRGADAPAGATSEPPFLARGQIPGVAEAARVLNGTVTLRQGSTEWGRINLLAMVPAEFARTAWYRDDLNDAGFFEYLGLLSRHAEGILVSREFFRQNNLSVGDTLELVYKEQPVEVIVAGEVAYWPSLDPSRRAFVVMNLDFLQENTALEPYDVWYRLTDDARVQDIVDGLADLGVYVTEVREAGSRIVELLREPYRMGFFGTLSIGFLVSILVTVLGFLIFTFYSVRGRLVPFGALRANGLSVFQLAVVVALEQLANLGLGLGVGVGLGRLCTRLFLPFLRDRAGSLGAVPPFLVVWNLGDLRGILLAMAGLFVAAVLGLSLYLARTRLFQALKMGGDA
jgi:putative ABC transport system permease protein